MGLKEWHDHDPDELDHWLDRRMSSSSPSEFIVSALAHGGLFECALNHALALPETEREPALRMVFIVRSATTPLEAWFLADTLDDPELRAFARDTVLESASDAALPQLASLALEHHPSSSDRPDILRNVLSRWTLQDPAEAAAWVDRHPVPSEIHDTLASHLVFQCDGLNRPAETAIAWAESISRPDLRYRAVAAAARELAGTDAAMANDSVRNSTVLSEEEKHDLLASLQASATGHPLSSDGRSGPAED